MAFLKKEFLSKPDKDRVAEAIRKGELLTSGELKVYIESRCEGSVNDRALAVFHELNLHQTKEHNAVLFYVAYKSQQFGILGDEGIHQHVKDEFWESVKTQMFPYFKEGNYADGLIKGIELAAEQLKIHFPHQDDDQNELSNEVVEGK